MHERVSVRILVSLPGGLPLHSFSSLLQELATRSRHQCPMRSDPMGPLLIRLTAPTPLQKRAMEL